MAKLTIAPKLTEKIMRKIKGEKGSPFESVDNLGKMPDYRNPTDSPGTEKKKLKKLQRLYIRHQAYIKHKLNLQTQLQKRKAEN